MGWNLCQNMDKPVHVEAATKASAKELCPKERKIETPSLQAKTLSCCPLPPTTAFTFSDLLKSKLQAFDLLHFAKHHAQANFQGYFAHLMSLDLGRDPDQGLNY